MKSIITALLTSALSFSANAEPDPFAALSTAWSTNSMETFRPYLAPKVTWEWLLTSKDEILSTSSNVINELGPSSLIVHPPYRWADAPNAPGRIGIARTTDSGAPGYLILQTNPAGQVTLAAYGLDRDGGFLWAAEAGQSLDAATSIVGVASGAAELNPMGLPLVLTSKAVLLAAAPTMSYQKCVGARYGSSIFGGTAGAANLGTLVAGSAGGPVGLALSASAAIAAIFLFGEKAENSAELSCLPDQLLAGTQSPSNKAPRFMESTQRSTNHFLDQN